MDLTVLHSLMRKKGYHYFDGRINGVNDNLCLKFSTGYNGRGYWVEFRIGSIDNDIRFRDDKSKIVEHDNINDDTIFDLIKTLKGI